ncbi:hypothetical protein EJ07DRAFT_153530 [Lizonia empirigonia]|nr:hypothetical protein EJ07DRAFT_153530 [Lizonia empirigonia]
MSSLTTGPGGSSPLLQLPREIRDLIYEYLLVPGLVPISCAVTKAPKSLVAVGGEVGFCESLYQTYRLTYPLEHRSTWSVSVETLAIPADNFQLESSTVHMTYQLDSSRLKDNQQLLELQLLQVCQQLHAEVSEAFYSKNTFSFMSSFAVPAAAMFLGDRWTDASRCIRSLEMHLKEDQLGMAQDGAFPENDGYFQGHDADGHYTRLCALLASDFVKIRGISSIICTRKAWAVRCSQNVPLQQLAGANQD